MKASKRAKIQPSLFGEEMLPEPMVVEVNAADLPSEAKIPLITTADQLAELARVIESAPQVAMAVATHENEAVGVAFSNTLNQAWYLPFAQATLAREQIAAVLSECLAKTPCLIAHDAKSQLHALRKIGVNFRCPIFDTQIAAHLCNTPFSELSLPSCAKAKLNTDTPHIEDLLRNGRRMRSLSQMASQTLAPHFGQRVSLVLQLAACYRPLMHTMNQTALFEQCEMPLFWTLFDMECVGVAIDVPYLQRLGDELGQQMAQLEQAIFKEAGEPFNIGSFQQLSYILFDKMKLPTDKLHHTWRSGKVSTSAWSLEEIKDKHVIIPLILDHREMAKLKGTYADALPELIRPETGRLHTTFNQVNTVTGRLSSTNPNLQNVPITTELGRRVRKAFIAREGGVVISADYSQVELRILAHLADDPGLQAAFNRGEDIHATTAAAIFNVPIDQVSTEQRGHAKKINFGIAYGMGKRSLAAGTGMSETQAEAFIARYFRAFPNLQRWLSQTKRDASRLGYVETILGRRRYLPRLLPDANVTPERRSRAEREAINTPVQGSAADIMKLAMMKLHNRLKSEGYAARMTLQVHDEVLVDCPREEVESVRVVIREALSQAYELRAPLAAEMGVGSNWDEAV